MGLCQRLKGGPKSGEDLWHLVNDIAEKRRSTSGDVDVRKEDKFFQGMRDEAIYVSRGYDTGVEPAFKFEKNKHIFGKPDFNAFANANGVWKKIPSISGDMQPSSATREFDLYNYSLLLMLKCE